MVGPAPFVPASVEVLRPFVDAGVVGAGEVHLAATVARLSPGTDPLVLLAVAVAARAPQLGHVGIELAAAADRVLDRFDEVAVALPWPDAGPWAAALASSPAVAAPADARREPLAPLVWDGTRIYLQRYWAYEAEVAADLRLRAGASAGGPAIDHAIAELFPAPGEGGPDLQLAAATVALGHRLSVIAGGPGTGKTRTVARLLAAAQRAAAADGRNLEVALAAPTGKAAARMTEAVRQAVAEARAEGVIDAALAERLVATEATTIHALLGWAPGVAFRHDREHPLTHDLVVIDETSMVSLPLMARLLQAVRPEASLVLVGDPDQLASVDAGTVLADLVGERGPTRTGPALVAPRRRRAAPVEDPATPRLFDPDVLAAPTPTPASPPPEVSVTADAPLEGLVTVLERVHRFGAGSGIAALADAVRRGDADAALALLDGSRADLTWARPDRPAAVASVEEAVVAAATEVARAALAGDAEAGLAAALRVKVLAATRHGDGGLYDWTARIEAAVGAAVPELAATARWYAGRPVLVTANDRINRLANGDVGLVVARDGGTAVALPQGAEVRYVPVSRLHEAETWWAMTIHKSQGSEFPHVVVSLPGVRSPILTRELLYTAITRAREQVTLVATEEALRLAIGRPVARASGLGARLWPT
ncbi:exodeoxyribonuclease V subunit alpha [Aquihabitans sp. G128]|uniref:exodeoxyribonuclease V subunit alpha n=1 Tax=Aquihabitans sp. G128 TaxID=2849779 RepID=UPI001C24FBCE|nr:exodeoxyribonuclease V subunit alpha [Aquihabitans sp. G128]QXC63296.1 exodeoxyribonuclease V subunit alpha [Aquihabitans sp. G128]